jgi:D-xylulose reductase
MKALVLEEKGRLNVRDVPIEEHMSSYDVTVDVKACGICGSDVHYYTEGAIGEFVVKEPMILGHEAAGVVVAKGEQVTNLEIGDLVCMEPGVPDLQSDQVLEGNYNLDPGISFWATPPIHGCLREQVVHPSRFCFKLPKGVSVQEGAMMEPLATGIEAAKKAQVKPGDTALVVGAGTIGIMVAISCLAAGCSKVFISDVKEEKLAIAASYTNIIPINGAKQDLEAAILAETNNEGVDCLFEASGSPMVYPSFFRCAKRGATVVLVGMMNGTVPLDVALLQVRGLRIETLFRYTNTFDRAVALVANGLIDVKPLISKVFPFEKAVEAYEYAAEGHPDVVKVMIEL